ncbi:ATP-binding protein [Desulfitobacterium sp.]|uniref:ATP-binding protein n=1 Tax=Desulfitobacterium sp. TaxID=49981 RepID=UPI002B21FEA7|nr:ATP-binding protein [Desulfitobacterium sp.]MEA4902562.1 ATP-binding protein [Desulfitobacterium sp.]
MNFIDTLKSVKLVLATEEVPLIVGESGIGKTALAKEIAEDYHWSLIVINGNLLKEGEIGGLPTVESYAGVNDKGDKVEKKTTVYAIHHKLREIDEEISTGKTVLLFIDEINRCEHTVQQELMNLILNREINGYHLPKGVKILAAMNPSSKYGSDFDYQVVDMDAAQENRFVWLYMEPDANQWLDWAIEAGIEPKVIEFISTFPDYLHKINEDDIRATPRSYERISSSYKIYKEKKDSIPRSVFLNVIKGNVGRVIAEEFVSFVESDYSPLISYEDVFSGSSLHESLCERIKNESHTRLYLSAKNILKTLEANMKYHHHDSDSFFIPTESTNYSADGISATSDFRPSYDECALVRQDKATKAIALAPAKSSLSLRLSESRVFFIDRLIEFLNLYPVDLKVGIMKDIKNSYPEIYKHAIENEAFVESYFESYRLIR